MRSIITFAFCAALLTSCADANVQNQPEAEPKNYEELVKEYISTDTSSGSTFLGFKFGMTEQQVENHLQSLIKASKIDPKTYWEYSTLGIKVDGYPYKLYLNDSIAYNTLLECVYYNDKLSEVNLLPEGIAEEDSIVNFPRRQYGNPVYTTAKESTFGDSTFYWLRNGYEISYSPTGLVPISFSDPKAKLSDLEDRRILDTLSKKIKADKAAEAKQDFQ